MKNGSPESLSPGDTDMPAYPDEQLVLEALDDSHPAFEQLVKQYQYRVLRTITSIISDEQAAHDVAQETFLSAWSDLAKLREREKFGRWLNRIAINLSKDWLRDQQRYQKHSASFKDMTSLTQERKHYHEKLRQEVWDAIDELTEAHREAVTLYYISGYSYKEISEMLSVPVSTVRGRLEKARNQLRKEFLDMVTQLQLEIDSAVHKFLKEHAKQDGVSVEGLIIRLIERYKRDIDTPEIAVRKVAIMEFLGGTVFGAPSPDGRYLSFTDGYSDKLAVRDLTTGEYRNLTNEGIWDGPGYWAVCSIWSPDSKQVAYTWWDGGKDRNQLRIVGLDGSEPRVLYPNENKEWGWLQAYEWSRDGKSILALFFTRDSPTEIVLVSVADGSVRVLKSGGFWPDKMSLSPDGRYVVYDWGRNIFLLATDGSGEIPLVEHPAADYGPVWSPDGKSIVFVSDRSGTYDAWLLQMTDGRPVGEPTLVKKNIGDVFPMGFTRSGSLYYGLVAGGQNVYVATLDPATGELLSPPTKAIQRFEGFNRAPAWSPDGKYLAYLSGRHVAPGGPMWVLMIRSMETGEERELHDKLEKALRLHWSPDGRSILIGSRGGLELIDVQTGDVTPITRADCHGSVWSPDGKTVFYIRSKSIEGGRPCSIVTRDLETGGEQELRRGGVGTAGLTISPDGRQLAFTGEVMRVLKVMPAAGGEPRELLRLEAPEGFRWHTGLAWTPDGRYILFGEHKYSPDESHEHGLFRIPAEGGEPQKLLAMDSLGLISVHPDGQRIAFTGGLKTREVWAMENFLPGFTADK